MSDFNKIWQQDSDGKNSISEETMLAWLEGRLPDDERRKVEEALNTEGMESDAMEGLQQLSSEEISTLKINLNHELQKSLTKKRKRRRGLPSQQWTIIAIGLILLLAVVCYVIIRLMKH